MARTARSDEDDRWHNLQIIVKPQNRAIIHLLSDKKPRMPVEICSELRNKFPKATLYIAMKELVMRKILVPMIIEEKGSKKRTLTEILGYTVDKDVYQLIKILDEADKQAKDISMK